MFSLAAIRKGFVNAPINGGPESTSRERLDQQWSHMIEAWFPGGKDDPNLLMMRMDLGQAKIWDSNLGLIGTAKMLLGMDTRKEAQDNQVETAL